MKSHSIRFKLYISFLAVIALFAASTAWTVSNIIALNGKESDYSKRAEGIRTVVAIEVAAMDKYRAQANLSINGNPGAIKRFEEAAGEMGELLKKADESAVTDQEKQQIAGLKKLDQDFDQNFKEKLVPAFQKQDKALISEINYQSDRILTEMDALIKSLIKSYQEDNNQAFEEMTGMSLSTKSQAIILLAVSIVLAAILAFLLSRQIINPLGRLVEIFNQMSRGDLTGKAAYTGGDEIGKLGESFNAMTDNLKGLVTELAEKARLLTHSADQLTSQAQATSTGASGTAASVGEIATTIDQVAQNAQEVSSISAKALRDAENGIQGIGSIVRQIEVITATSGEASNSVSMLSRTLENVNQIVDLITQIAEQTNLLALNAAIEAARAGEQGRGFSVVAEEVRKLAEQSASAAKEINQLITKVQAESQKAVGAMTEGNRQIREGSIVIKQVGGSLTTIIDSVGGLAAQVQNVAAATKQIAGEVQNVAATTEETTAAMEEVAASTDQLNSMSSDLSRLAARFKL